METATAIDAEEITSAVCSYVVALQTQLDRRFASQGYTWSEIFSAEPGRRYIKVVKTSNGSKSAVAFIDKTTGHIYKPDGWSRPAKHRRGNVLSVANGMEAMSPTGHVAYLK